MGGTALLCLVKMFQHQRHGVFFGSSPAASIGRGTAKKCSSEPDCGLLYVVQTAFGRVVECGRVKCA